MLVITAENDLLDWIYVNVIFLPAVRANASLSIAVFPQLILNAIERYTYAKKLRFVQMCNVFNETSLQIISNN